MDQCKKDVIPLLTHLSYVLAHGFIRLTHICSLRLPRVKHGRDCRLEEPVVIFLDGIYHRDGKADLIGHQSSHVSTVRDAVVFVAGASDRHGWQGTGKLCRADGTEYLGVDDVAGSGISYNVCNGI